MITILVLAAIALLVHVAFLLASLRKIKAGETPLREVVAAHAAIVVSLGAVIVALLVGR